MRPSKYRNSIKARRLLDGQKPRILKKTTILFTKATTSALDAVDGSSTGT
jgi:hypothetical protein